MTSHAPITIVGAGLAGLIAAHAWPSARIIERAPAPAAAHRALLRFRSDAVARLTGIEFKRVTVRKGIWSAGGFVPPDLRLANLYSQKCLGLALADRSIWNLDPAARFIAPLDFHERLLAQVGGRVSWDTALRLDQVGQHVVSTAPLSETAQLLARLPGALVLPEFRRAGIFVRQRDLGPKVDLYQTVYFPDAALSLYRASITGRALIMEFAGEAFPSDIFAAEALVMRAFGLADSPAAHVSPAGVIDAQQRFGKIADIDAATRQQLLFRLTHELGIYSLGRFATWRNILLDDVVHDIDVVKSLMRGGAYDLRQASAKVSPVKEH